MHYLIIEGRRFEVYQEMKWMPFLEKRIACKENYKLMRNLDSITVEYNKLEHEIYLNTNQRRIKRNLDGYHLLDK